MKARIARILSCFLLVLVSCCLTGAVIIVLSQLHGISFHGKIALQGNVGAQNVGIFSYNRVFHTLERITPQNILAISPAWSPDGTKLAFVQSDPDQKEFHIALLEVSSRRIETLLDQGMGLYLFDWDTALAWSPDGSQLLFDGTLLTPGSATRGCHALFLYQLDQKVSRPLNIEFCKSQSANYVHRLDLSWFPNAVPLVGVAHDMNYHATDDIYLLNPALTKADWVTQGAYPVWRPGTKDFSFICSSGQPRGFPHSICLYSMEHGTVTKIFKDYSYDKYAWSPDGRSILYVDRGFAIDDTAILTLANIETGDKYPLIPLGTYYWDRSIYSTWYEGKALWSFK